MSQSASATVPARLSKLVSGLAVCAALAVAWSPSLCAPTWAQTRQPGDDGAGADSVSADDPAKLLEDFVYYTLVAKPELAQANLSALLAKGLSDRELVAVLEEGRTSLERFNRAIDKALRMADLQELAAELGKRVHDGRLDLARDPARINDAIAKLQGTIREQRIAAEQLRAAGEYAVPALLRQMVQGRDDSLRAGCLRILRDIGRLAVTPLTAALPGLDATTQRQICDLLGEVRYPHAAPALLELSRDDRSPQVVRDAARLAYRNVGGQGDDLSAQYTNLGLQYFNRSESLLAYPAEATNNIWSYDTHVGLVPTPVPTPIFHDVMAMRSASRALHFNASNRAALSLMVASNLRRENDLPEGQTDPIYGEAPYSPQFYATVFGTQTCVDVLSMAMRASDTPLVLDAIAALRQTTGGSNLVGRGGQTQPLLSALQYPSRRVQYDAALTLARALPSSGFANDVAVVPLLASAVRAGAQSYAALVVDDEENRRVEAGRVGRLGYVVVAQAANVAGLYADVAAAPAVDLVIVRRSIVSGAVDAVRELNQNPRTAGAPVLVVADPAVMPDLQQQFADNSRVLVASTLMDESAFSAAADDLLRRAMGGRISEDEAEAYAIESLSALRDIAVSNSPVYRIADAEAALLEALVARGGGTRLLVADILALIDSAAAQRALLDAALAAPDDEQVQLLDRVADSVKRYGSRAEAHHVAAVLDLVASASGDTADAAARVHGAMNLSASDAIKLLPR